MISQKFSESFYAFVKKHEELSHEQRNEIIQLFEDKTIQTIFSVSLYLIFWSFVVAFIDATLLTRGVVFTFLEHTFLNSFLPSFVFILINATVKFIFIYNYTKKRVEIPLKHIFIGVIPLIGSLFFSAYLLRNKMFFFSVMKDYFVFIKKDFKWLKILRDKKGI